MQYRLDRKGTPLSLLGYGCMRFEKKGAGYDLEKAERDLLYAVEKGINYFDTAYIYANSEAVLGEVFKRNNLREKVYIATKLPHYLIRSLAGLEKLFQTELKRLQTDYIDYYLMHMLTDVETWQKLVEMGITTWIKEKLESGQIRNIGFSYHGATEMFQQLVDIYPWDFCMIQYNYVDEHTQAGRAGLEYAHKKGLAVMIMEPLRGGRLVNHLPNITKQRIEKHKSGYSAAEWSFRWLFAQKEITCVLSGMSTPEMIEDNVKIVSNYAQRPFTLEEMEFIEQIKKDIALKQKVGCTGCLYCMPCPVNVDIPGAFSAYNAMYNEKKSSARKDYLKASLLRKKPTSASNCIKCNKCVSHCPQNIDIPKQLMYASKDLENYQYKIARQLIKTFKLWK